MFDIADLKCEEILVSTCSIPKNVVVFTHLIAVKFEATLGCIDYLFGKFCVTLFVVCIFFYWQKYNADYELSAKQGADTLAYIALLEEKLLPALVGIEKYFITTRNSGSEFYKRCPT